MRDNMYNSDDPALITKKFWSHHKFTTKSHRLPECMYFKSCFRNTALDKANLINTFSMNNFQTVHRMKSQLTMRMIPSSIFLSVIDASVKFYQKLIVIKHMVLMVFMVKS